MEVEAQGEDVRAGSPLKNYALLSDGGNQVSTQLRDEFPGEALPFGIPDKGSVKSEVFGSSWTTNFRELVSLGLQVSLTLGVISGIFAIAVTEDENTSMSVMQTDFY